MCEAYFAANRQQWSPDMAASNLAALWTVSMKDTHQLPQRLEIKQSPTTSSLASSDFMHRRSKRRRLGQQLEHLVSGSSAPSCTVAAAAAGTLKPVTERSFSSRAEPSLVWCSTECMHDTLICFPSISPMQDTECDSKPVPS